MSNLFRYVKFFKESLIRNVRCLSINKFDLIECSRNIQLLIKESTEENSSKCQWFSNSLNEIHQEYPLKKIATSTKEIYQLNSSKFNSIYIELENDRKKQIGFFEKANCEEFLLLHLRYIRYLEVAYIYRLITFDIHLTMKELFNSILHLTKKNNKKSLKESNDLLITYELTFFINYLSSIWKFSDVKSFLSETFVVSYLLNSLFQSLSKEDSLLLVNQLCLTLHLIVEIPSSSTIDQYSSQLLKYLIEMKCSSLEIVEYLIDIANRSNLQSSMKILPLLNKYFNEIEIEQYDWNILCSLMNLITSYSYSHQIFHLKILHKLIHSKKEFSNDMKMNCRLIYYLCLMDPTNRFESRSTIVQLSEQVSVHLTEQMKFPQWIVQAQYGMMLNNIYNYQLLFSMINNKFFPLLFRDSGTSTKSIPSQLYQIHHGLLLDRPTLQRPLLNHSMLSFANHISNEYRSSVRSKQYFYNQFLNDLKDIFNRIYGDQVSDIINTNEHYPYLLFDFLEVNLPDKDQLKSIGINTKQRIAVLPIVNSMFIRQQRSDGSLVRVFSAHTTMKYRFIQKNNYQVFPIFHSEYQRALRNNTIQTYIETTLALKTLPNHSD